MDHRAGRAAKNEALFRDVNEHIAETTVGWQDDRLAAMCECHTASCQSTVELSIAEYEAVRAHADRFLLVDGHEDAELERVVERTDRFIVVEKLGEGRGVARHLDPRA